MKKFLEKNILKIVISIVALVVVAFIGEFLLGKDPGGKTGLQVVAELPASFVIGVLAAAVGAFFAIRALIRKYKKDGVNYGGIDLGIWLVVVAFGILCIRGCEAKTDSSVPRNVVDSTIVAADSLLNK